MKPSVVAKVLSYAGLTGSAPATNAFAPSPRNSSHAQDDFDRAGELANPDIWSSYNSAMSRPRTLEEQLRIWDEMSHWDLMAAALSEITDEATQTDSVSPGLLWYECSDKGAEEDLNSMLADVGAEDTLKSQIWHTAGFGNNFEKLDYSVGEGVKGFNTVHPMEMRRYWLRRNRRCVGFRWSGEKPNKEEIFKLGQGMQIARVALNNGQSSGAADLEHLWYPWDFMHIRRLYRSRQTEHGEPLFEEAQGIYKKLRMAIDQMVVLRAQIQPDRYAINIDVKDQPPIEHIKTVNRWKQSLRSKLSFGSGAGGVNGAPDDFKSFYNAMSLDTILWIAKPRDFAHAIEKIAGTASVPDVGDIEMLTNLFFAIIGMPKSWIGLGSDAGGSNAPASGKALLAQDMRFLRKIKSIRQPVTAAYTWLGYFHCMLKGYDVSDLELEAKMPPIGGLEEQMKLEMLEKQVQILDQLGEIMPKFNLPREAWIDVVFRKYMHLPDEIVDAFLTALPAEQEPAPLESVKKSTPSNPHQMLRERVALSRRTAKKAMMEEIIKKVGPDQERILQDMHDIMNGNTPRRNRRYRQALDVLQHTSLKENDIIVTGMGQQDPLNNFKDIEPARQTTVTQRFQEGYRSAMDAHLGHVVH